MKISDYLLLFEEPNTEIEDLFLAIELFRIDIVDLLDDDRLFKVHSLIREIIDTDEYYELPRIDIWNRFLEMEVPL